jgi:hypothetical protein
MRLTVYNRFSLNLESRYFGDDSELLLVPVEVFKRVGEGWMDSRWQVLVPLSEFALGAPTEEGEPNEQTIDPAGSRHARAAAGEGPLAQPPPPAPGNRRSQEPAPAQEVTTRSSSAMRRGRFLLAQESSVAKTRAGEPSRGLPASVVPD